MKKRKFNLLLELATLCLCVAAIAFGVYSAKNASLNVSGTVGFTAHNCDVYVAGKITGGIDADLNSITKYVSDAENATEDTFRSIGESYNWNIGTIYFDDINATGNEIAKPITITLKVYNKSAFKVNFTFNENFLPHDHLDVTVDSSNITMEANETESNAHTINATITLKDENLTAIKLEQSSVIGDFQRWTQFSVKPIEETFSTAPGQDTVKTTNKLCTTMGHSIVGTSDSDAGTDGLTKTEIIWYAFAVRGEGNSYTRPDFVPDENLSITTGTNEIWYSLYGVDMTDVDYKNNTFWFIQENVVAGGYNINDNLNQGISFGSGSIYAQVQNNNTSNVYDFLNNLGDYSNNNGYTSKTGITDDELSKIDSRNVNESYNSLSCQFASKLWLINCFELGLLYNQPITSQSSGYYIKAYGISNNNGGFTGAYWWLRSPNLEYEDLANCVDWTGFFSPDPDGMFITDATAGIRAACQITL